MKEAAKATRNLQLKRERLKRCLSQAQVAQEIGTTSFNVSRWERGVTTPGPYLRQKLCELFAKSSEELGLIEIPSPTNNHNQSPPIALSTELTPSTQPTIPGIDPAVPPPLVQTQGINLIGRARPLQSLKRQLGIGVSMSAAPQPLVAIHGLPGVGKTAIATTLAHDPEVQTHFRDGILWAGLGRDPDLASLLGRWSRLLSYQAEAHLTPNELESLTQALRDATVQRRLLIIIDDAWKIEEALAFKIGGPLCAYLVTTRSPELALRFAGNGTTSIPPLNEDQSIQLLEQLTPDIASEEPQEVRALVQSVGGLPLALSLMGNHLRVQAYSGHRRRLHTALRRLQRADERLRLAQFQSPGEANYNLAHSHQISLQAVIDVSDQQLDDQASYTLRTLALFPSRPNTFSEDAACAVSTLPVEVLDTLTDAGLLESDEPGRYRLHQTISDYALQALQLLPEREAIEQRLISYYCGLVEAYPTKYAFLDQEYENIMAALLLAHERSLDAASLPCIRALAPYLAARGLSTFMTQLLGWTEQLALVRNDESLRLWTLLQRGQIEERQGNLTQAEQLYHEALTLAHILKDQAMILTLQAHRGEAAVNRGDYDLAFECLQEGLTLARAIGAQRQACSFLRNLGEAFDDRGEPERATTFYLEGLAIARSLEDWEMASALLQNLGVKAERQGLYQKAASHYSEGLRYAQAIDHRQRISAILMNMGVLAVKQGDYLEAERLYQRSLEIAHALKHQLRVGGILQNLGILEGLRANYPQADRYMQQSLEIARTSALRWLACETLCEWGEIQYKRNQLAQARQSFEEALEAAQELGTPSLHAQATFGLARIFYAQSSAPQARAMASESLRLFKELGSPEQIKAVEVWLASLPPIPFSESL